MSLFAHHPTISIPSSPSTSPPSSPSTFPDSSPASSPRSYPSDDFEYKPLESLAQHPFAGSAKQTKNPRIYEQKQKKRSPSPSSPLIESKKVRYSDDQLPSPVEFKGQYFDSHTRNNFDPGDISRTRYLRDAKSPEQLFRDVTDMAVTESSRHICFEQENLTFIPEDAICDLQNIVILDERSERVFATQETLARSSASNALAAQHRRRSQSLRMDLTRTSSTRILSGVPREQMQLLLADNALIRLPPQLFRLEHLAVLSLRSNMLTYLPPEISLLTSLKELNVSNNRLSFLPSEMMGMKLSSLSVQPNPFITPPSNAETAKFRRTLSRHRTQSKAGLFQERPRLASPVKTIFENGIPSLFEVCLRTLFSVSTSTSFGRSRFEVEFPYDLPADAAARLPPLVLRRLHFACPGTVKGYSADAHPPPDSDSVTGVGFCPSPHHRMQDSRGPLFFQHVEERLTWESTIAGVENLGEIPVQWRGCQKGCLSFLDTKDSPTTTHTDPSSMSLPDVPVSSVTQANPAEILNLADVVKPVAIESAGFTDAEDFDDE
ncbi:hypothetical protein GYMLUDRAFT_358547 [Collybiopsis luxurians FD-317 M1]|nr:hypothetical protein GYMLUDRAFT_358547 [Collybiopsis luxurians FD-317 M1]